MIAAVSLTSLARSAVAEECCVGIPDHPAMRDGWYLSAGAMWANSNVTANLSTGAVGAAALIDFENDLGLPENNVIGLFDARWHFAKHWKVELEYFNLDRSDTKQIERALQWGNLNIPPTVPVTSTFNLRDIRASIGWSFFRTQDKEVGVGLGAHVTRLQASLSTPNLGSDAASQTAPLPFLSLYARLALTDRWLLSMRVDRLSLTTGNIDGKVFASGADILYQPWRHFGVGLGYRDVNYQISSTSSDWRGEAQIQESGPSLSVVATF